MDAATLELLDTLTRTSEAYKARVEELSAALALAEARQQESEHIWCDSCEEVRPLKCDHLPAGGPNDHAATDLLCGVCGLVVATLHHVAPSVPG